MALGPVPAGPDAPVARRRRMLVEGIRRRGKRGKARMKLTDYDVLTFDCYGTLIDWEDGIFTALKPWLDREAASTAG